MQFKSWGQFGTALSFTGSLMMGNYAEEASDVSAQRMRWNANNARAVAAREYEEAELGKELMLSRAKAIAGASGGGVSDPTVVRIMANIEAEGEMQALNRLWTGEVEYSDNMYQASVLESEGAAAKTAGWFSAFDTLLTGFGAYKKIV